MKFSTLALACLCLPLGSALAQADDSALRRCRAMADNAARLACYDALPMSSAPSARAPAPAGTAAPAMAGAAAAAGPATAKAPATAPAAVPQQEFGQAQLPSATAEVKFIDSQIMGKFTGWRPNQQFELANGQVWQVVDGSSVIFEATNPAVRVERGAFSAFYLSVAGLNQTPRVRRVK